MTPAAPARTVFVVEDDEAMRDALSMLLRAAGLPVQAFGSPLRFLEAYPQGAPGCLLLDVRMPHMTGLELQDLLVARGVRIPIVFISGHGDIPMAVEAVRKGAVDFIEKPFEDGHVLRRVLDAMQEDARRAQAERARHESAARLAALTSREREVLELVLAGKPSRAIAGQLFITVKTVEFHRARIMQKLGVRTAAELFHLCLS